MTTLEQDNLAYEIKKKSLQLARIYAQAVFGNANAIMTYYDVKEAIKAGLSDEDIIYRAPIGGIRHEIEAYIPMAKKEIQTEKLIAEAELGKVLYE